MKGEWEGFKRQMKEDFREDGDYEALLTSRIAKINGWPTNWSYDPNDLADLTIREQLKILPLRLKDEGSLQHALNRHCDLQAELEKRL